VPTFVEGDGDKTKTFLELVIHPLVNLKRTPEDNLHSWLKIMFSFCQGKPFVYSVDMFRATKCTVSPHSTGCISRTFRCGISRKISESDTAGFA
jgi:hypothetical protein